MKKVSNAFTAKMKESLRTWVPRMTINGVEVEGDIQAGLTINMGSCGVEQFSIGAMFVPYITASIKDCSTTIQNQELFLEMGLKLDDETIEYLPVGYFTASKVNKDKFVTSIEAYGRLMSKGGGLYASDLVWPTTIENVINEISEKMGVPIITKNVDTSGTIYVQMVGLLYREALQYIAGLLGGFCTEDSNGNIILTKYELRESVSIDTDFCYAFPTKDDSAYEVTGIEVIVSGDSADEEGNITEGQKYSYGSFVNVTASNPYMTDNLFDKCKSNVVGFKYLPATVNFLGDLRLEPWDYLIVTDDDEVFEVPCMSITHTWDGGIVTVVTAPGTSRTETAESFGGPLTAMVERTYQELMTAKQIITSKISADEADLKYAKIDKTNIDTAWIEDLLVKGNFLANSVNSAIGSFSKWLTGVRILGDLIEAETLKAGALIIRGTDGLYRRLNLDSLGELTVDSDEKYNQGLDGSVLVKESITAEKINVFDLFAQNILSTGDFNMGGKGALVYDKETDSLDIRARSINIGSSDVVTKDNLEIGGRNLISNGKTMINENYCFGDYTATVSLTNELDERLTDEDGNHFIL